MIEEYKRGLTMQCYAIVMIPQVCEQRSLPTPSRRDRASRRSVMLYTYFPIDNVTGSLSADKRMLCS
jgi:hypothetical protein